MTLRFFIPCTRSAPHQSTHSSARPASSGQPGRVPGGGGGALISIVTLATATALSGGVVEWFLSGFGAGVASWRARAQARGEEEDRVVATLRRCTAHLCEKKARPGWGTSRVMPGTGAKSARILFLIRVLIWRLDTHEVRRSQKSLGDIGPSSLWSHTKSARSSWPSLVFLILSKVRVGSGGRWLRSDQHRDDDGLERWSGA